MADEEERGVASLGPGSTGSWRVTAEDAVYVLDLRPTRKRPQARVIRRPAGGRPTWRYDATELLIVEVEVWPVVGARMRLVLDDPDGGIGETMPMETGIVTSIVEIT